MNRRLRIILAAVLVILLIIAVVYLLRSSGSTGVTTPIVTGAASPVVAGAPTPVVVVTVGITAPVVTPNVDEIVQTLFAQTVIAKANVQVNVTNSSNVQVVVPTTPAPANLPPAVFPDEARRALAAFIGNGGPNPSYQIVSTRQATRPRAFVGALANSPDEGWCVVISPPVTIRGNDPVFGGNYTSEGVTHFSVVRTGLLWEPADRDGSNTDIEGSRNRWLQAGCDNW